MSAQAVYINGKYRLGAKIGSGSFGEIYEGFIDHRNGEIERVAIKLEPHNTKCPQLAREARIYKLLQGASGIPKIYWFGSHGSYDAMVMEMLGSCLEDMFEKCKRKFSLQTVLKIADQLLERIDWMHNRNLIHRDIKPENFLIGTGTNANTVYIIDFGLSKRYRDPKTGQHIPNRDGKQLTGTPRYVSINTHLGKEQSRRDDFISIGYLLIYFMKGSLPWQGLKAKTQAEKYQKILEKKQETTVDKICEGLPAEFHAYMDYVYSLGFDAKPNTPHLRGLFRDLYRRQGFDDREGFDWDLPKLQGEKPQPPPLNLNPASPTAPVRDSLRVLPYVSPRHSMMDSSGDVGGETPQNTTSPLRRIFGAFGTSTSSPRSPSRSPPRSPAGNPQAVTSNGVAAMTSSAGANSGASGAAAGAARSPQKQAMMASPNKRPAEVRLPSNVGSGDDRNGEEQTGAGVGPTVPNDLQEQPLTPAGPLSEIGGGLPAINGDITTDMEEDSSGKEKAVPTKKESFTKKLFS